MLGIVEAISREIKPSQIVLFGSQARGDHLSDSDYDICLITDNPATMEVIIDAKMALIGVTLHPVDIVAFSKDDFDRRKTIAGTLEYDIDKEGVMLYGGSY